MNDEPYKAVASRLAAAGLKMASEYQNKIGGEYFSENRLKAAVESFHKAVDRYEELLASER